MKSLITIISGLLFVTVTSVAQASSTDIYRIPIPGLRASQSSTPTVSIVGDGVAHDGACASGGASNCAVFSASSGYQVALSSGNQTATSSGLYSDVTSSTCKTSGKWYVEFTRTAESSPVGYIIYGEKSLSSAYTSSSDIPYQTTDNSGSGYYDLTGDVRNSAGSNVGNLGVIPAGGTIGVALDADAGTITYLYGTQSSTVTGIVTSNGVCPSVGYMHSGTVTLNAGQSSFVLPVPSGYYKGMW